ncbi:uncharacterized protein K444DRAFT_388300 [Hyaloscypha bicolor E]|uniref:Uncharacterized protein n=1 Tax=Hyaloscypha bicolor E TaxID=1095630 RepID=A0A2J6TCL1_9HELO|nr:uncharacterized protein K444DRAFT_388300 [Hyaloscypha bicolor E]PMD60743.1 hypothetical protein K444DRAFT_388300 [Hyaloscypha bicolor E]
MDPEGVLDKHRELDIIGNSASAFWKSLPTQSGVSSSKAKHAASPISRLPPPASQRHPAQMPATATLCVPTVILCSSGVAGTSPSQPLHPSNPPNDFFVIPNSFLLQHLRSTESQSHCSNPPRNNLLNSFARILFLHTH